MPRPLLSGVLAVLVLVTFFLGDALGMTPAGLGAAVAAAAVAAYLATRVPTAADPSAPAPSSSAPRDEKPSAHTKTTDTTDTTDTETADADAADADATDAPAREPAAEASPSATDDAPASPPMPDGGPPAPDYAPPPDAEAPTGSDGELSNLLPEDLADRYYANFLVPIRQSLPGTRYADLGTIPERIQVLIPDGPSARNALRNAVRAECRSVAVTPDEYMRQFGIYVYSPGQATSGVIVDVPTILHGRASEPSGLSAQALYDRFADHLKALIQQEPSEGMPISIHRNVQSFPLNG